MKKKSSLFWILIPAFIVLGSGRAFASVPQTPAEHLALSQSYQEKADAQKQLVEEHQKMKAEYKEMTTHGNPKFRNSPMLRKMYTHCDGIIAKARALELEFEKFAEWHKMRAKELEGQ